MNSIGFMQGRLSPQVDGKIQAFPWKYWQQEFSIAQGIGVGLMEWTLDQESLYDNPLMTVTGQQEISRLKELHRLTIPSLTGDCFMQAPFWKAHGAERESLERDFRAIVKACAAVGISILVVPLVDNGRLDTVGHEDNLIAFLHREAAFLAEQRVRVAFESDFVPAELARFVGRFDSDRFGINYDIGNSAGLGMLPDEEFSAYGDRILNVHVKDRVLGGTTVPLGTGNADFNAVFSNLKRIGYVGNFILQTARAADGSHADAICRYRDMVNQWLEPHAT